MYGDEDFKRETGSVYAGDLVAQIRELHGDINSLIDLLLSDETIDITLVGSPINNVIENIKEKFSHQKNKFFENFDEFILKKRDFYFNHLIGNGLIFEEDDDFGDNYYYLKEDIKYYKKILKNNILDYMAVHTEFTDEEIYNHLWIKSEKLINLMEVDETRKRQIEINYLWL